MNPGRKATGPRQPSRHRSLRAVVAVVGLCCALIAFAGCRHSQRPRAFLGDPEPAEFGGAIVMLLDRADEFLVPALRRSALRVAS